MIERILDVTVYMVIPAMAMMVFPTFLVFGLLYQIVFKRILFGHSLKKIQLFLSYSLALFFSSIPGFLFGGFIYDHNSLEILLHPLIGSTISLYIFYLYIWHSSKKNNQE